MKDPQQKPPVVLRVPDDHVMSDEECDALADAMVHALFAQADED
jgi:hypothetical protein